MNPSVILASSSPRRKELLEKAGVSFQVVVPDVDETPLKKESPARMVARLSQLKAQTIAHTITAAPSSKLTIVVLAADTTVVSAAKKNLGKPADRTEAASMIKALQGKKHHVFTAYTLLLVRGSQQRKRITRTIRTDVFIKKMNAREIEAYIDTGECMDKAGAYAAQGYGMAIIEKISGSYTNVVGLPIAQVMIDLKKLGWK